MAKLNVDAPAVSRRGFLAGSAAATAGLSLGFHVPFAGEAAAQGAHPPEVNAWVVIKPDDTVVIRIARSEMGQGTLTGLAQLVAEELECDWSKVTTESITAGQNLARNRVWGDMATGGSRGIRGSHDYVRRGGAAARIMLMQAAAQEWGVPAAELKAANGLVTHPASGRSARYGQLAEAAARLAPPDPKGIKLKDPKDWTIAGKPMKRLDTADKLTGRKLYAIDVKLPGMLCAAIQHCPVYGGRLESYDEAKIRDMPGVRGVVKVSNTAVAVVADTWWRARTALAALPIVWDEGRRARSPTRTIAERLEERPYRRRDERRAHERRRPQGDRRRGEDGRGRLRHAVPCACLHGDHELHREDLGRQRGGLGRDAERRSLARGALGRLRPAAREMRGAQARPRRRLRPARRRAGLRPRGGGDRQALPRHARQADLEPRGGPRARRLPADLADAS